MSIMVCALADLRGVELAPFAESLGDLEQLCRCRGAGPGEPLTVGVDLSGPEFAHLVWGLGGAEHMAVARPADAGLWSVALGRDSVEAHLDPVERDRFRRSAAGLALARERLRARAEVERIGRAAATGLAAVLAGLGAVVVVEHGSRWSVTKRAFTHERLSRVHAVREVWMGVPELLVRSPGPRVVTQRRCGWCGVLSRERSDWRADVFRCRGLGCGRNTEMSENVARVLFRARECASYRDVVPVEMSQVPGCSRAVAR